MGKSSLVCNIAENVALKQGKAGRPVLAGDVGDGARPPLHRLPGADLQGDKLRKGKVAEPDWPKVVEGLQHASSRRPLWIDDSSDLGMLELRAKARRLARPGEGRAAATGSG